MAAKWIRSLVVTSAAVAVLGLVASMAAGMQVREVVLVASGDTFVRAGAANTNEGGSPLLRVQASGDNRALVKFDQAAIEAAVAGARLISAKLRVTVADNAENWGESGDRTIDLHRMIVAWEEGNGINSLVPGRTQYRGDGAGATWNLAVDADISNSREDLGVDWEMGKPRQPDLHPWVPEPTATSVITNSMGGGMTIEWDVTDDVLAFLSSTPNCGWIIKKTNEGLPGQILFASRNYVAFYTANPDVTPPIPLSAGDPAPILILEVMDEPTEITLHAVRDTFLRRGSPNTNEGANPGMRLQASGDNRALVAFNLSNVPLERLTSATLHLNISEIANNWSNEGREVDVHRMLCAWAEGNGVNSEVPDRQQFRGSGPGATWNAAIDPDISNSNPDGQPDWNGATGFFAPATAPPVIHYNGLTGEVVWDVTEDVKAGAIFGWLIKKRSESQPGKVLYYTREGAAAAGNPDLAPRLVLRYGTP